ncbi:MAG: flagellar export protein FliJ [bacterium]
MKKFTFRLQRLMDAKRGEERLRQRDLGIEQQKLSDEEIKLQKLSDDLKQVYQEQREKLKKGTRVGDLLLSHQWQRNLRTRIRGQTKEVEKQESRVETAREVLVDVSREKKVLEKLRERRKDEHQHQVNTETQNQLDDIGARLHRRRKSSSSES